MATSFDVLVAMAQRLPGTVRGVATGGGWDVAATQIYLNDTLLLTQYQNDALIGATVLIESGFLAGAVLPVADSVQSTGRVLLSGTVWETAQYDYPRAGDRYLLVPGVFPFGLMEASITEAVRAWGEVETEVTLGTGDGLETTFDLPSGVTGDVVRVFQVTEDGDEFQYLTHWEETSAGVECEVAPFDGWTVRARVVSWPTLTPVPDWVIEAAIEYLMTAGTGGFEIWGDSGEGFVYAIAQTFTLAKRTKITELRLYMTNSDGVAYNVPVEIWGTYGSDPPLPEAGDSLETTTATVGASAAGWAVAELDGTLILDPGIYTLIAKADTAWNVEPSLQWNYGPDATYDDGAAYKAYLDGSAVGDAASDDMRFQVLGQVEILRAGAEVWPASVPVEFAAWYAAYALMRGRVGIPGQDHETMAQLMNYALERAENERVRRGDVGVRARERFFR